MKKNQKDVLNSIMELLEIGLSFEESPEIRNELDNLFKQQNIDLNQILETYIPTLLFQAIYNASWDFVNYFLDNGADLHYKADYKNHKKINSIAFAEILLKEIKNNNYKEAKEELKNINRLENDFDKGMSCSEITMQEFYAFKSQSDILQQVIFIEEFLRKYK